MTPGLTVAEFLLKKEEWKKDNLFEEHLWLHLLSLLTSSKDGESKYKHFLSESQMLITTMLEVSHM